MEKLRPKHVDRHSMLDSQIQSMVTFDVDTSQRKQSVTTSDRKTELVAITLTPCELCHSRQMCQSVKYIGIHKMSALAEGI